MNISVCVFVTFNFYLLLARTDGPKMDSSAEKQLAEMLKELKSRSKEKVILETGVFVLILLFLFVGNVLTLLVMILNPRMRTIPNMFVTSLAVSDLSFGVFMVCPLGVPVSLLSQWPFNHTTCQYQGYITIALSVASIHTMALMAVNRYFRIVKPSKYRSYFTKKKAMVMILVAWLYSMLVPFPYVLSGHKMIFQPDKFICFLNIDTTALSSFEAIFIGIPSCIIFYFYFRIFKTVRSHNNNLHLSGSGINAVNVEEVKVARTLFVIVVFFTLCWIPVLVIDLVDVIRGSWTFPREAYIAYSVLATLSTALNPLIYGVLNRNFRREYLKLLRCRYCRRSTSCCSTIGGEWNETPWASGSTR